jgi:signal transduction histidine kinase
VTGATIAAEASSRDSLFAIASLGLVAEYLSQPVCVRTREGRAVFVNAAYCELAGSLRDELIGRSEAEAFGDNKAVTDAELEAVESRRPVHVRQRFPTTDPRSQVRLTTRIPLIDGTGEVNHIVCVVLASGETAAPEGQLDDEIAHYERERDRALRSVQDELLKKERLMVLGQLAASLAHQIRNPLSVIANAVSLASKQIPRETGAIEALEMANEEVWVVNRIIADLLDYARIRPASRHPSRLADMISASLEEEPLPSDIEVRMQVDDTPVEVDAQQVQDAIRNLVRNAREAMDGAGILSFRSKLDGDWMELWVEDTGHGVSAEHRHLLFEPLVSSKPLGIGLGLPTARALVVNQGGTLDCVEAEGTGARFVMRLPMREPPPNSR